MENTSKTKFFKVSNGDILISPFNMKKTQEWYCEKFLEDDLYLSEIDSNEILWEEVNKFDIGIYSKIKWVNGIQYGKLKYKDLISRYGTLDEPDFIFAMEL